MSVGAVRSSPRSQQSGSEVRVNEKTNSNIVRAGNWFPMRPLKPQIDVVMGL